MSEFEDRLFTDLMTDHGEDLATARRAAPHRRVPRPVMVAAGALVLAGAATAGVVVAGGHDTPAYAVSVGPHGMVSVTIREVAAVGPVNAKLRKLGVPVRAVRMRQHCTAAYIPDQGVIYAYRTGRTVGGVSVLVRTRGLPAGQTIVIGWPYDPSKIISTPSTHADNPGVAVPVAAGRVTGRVPACLRPPAPY